MGVVLQLQSTYIIRFVKNVEKDFIGTTGFPVIKVSVNSFLLTAPWRFAENAAIGGPYFESLHRGPKSSRTSVRIVVPSLTAWRRSKLRYPWQWMDSTQKAESRVTSLQWPTLGRVWRRRSEAPVWLAFCVRCCHAGDENGLESHWYRRRRNMDGWRRSSGRRRWQHLARRIMARSVPVNALTRCLVMTISRSFGAMTAGIAPSGS